MENEMDKLSRTGLEIREKDSGMIIATVYKHNPNNQTEAQALEIADYIVNACNSHKTQAETIAKLREALKDVIRQSKSFQEKFIAYKPETISGLHMQSFAEIAEKALAETESQ